MKTRHAFTLVEILTVTVIIGILAALITAAVAGAMKTAKRARIGMEMHTIALAIEQSKNEFGEYPPDMFDDAAIVRYVKKRWPRLPSNYNDAAFIRGSINTAYGYDVDFTVSDAKIESLGSLALWLGGFPNSDGKLSGFSADPENPFFANPFVPMEERVYDKKAFLDWEVGDDKSVRFVNGGGGRFVPVVGTEIRNTFVPFVYFRGRADGGEGAYKIGDDVKQISSAAFGLCVPYIESENNGTIKWKNPATYQLIHPGLDGWFGGQGVVDRFINPGTGIGAADLDNLTNFSDYKELKSILP